MTGSGNPQEPTSRDRSSTGQAVQDQAAPAGPSPTAQTSDTAPPPTPAEAPPTPTAPVADEQVGTEAPQRGGIKGRLAALGASVASLAKRVYKGGTKKPRVVRRKRTTNRCVILTEVFGRPVAIGPYRNEQAARKDLARTHGQQVVELKTAAKHLAASAGGSPSAQR
jgi:hypothetical protein